MEAANVQFNCYLVAVWSVLSADCIQRTKLSRYAMLLPTRRIVGQLDWLDIARNRHFATGVGDRRQSVTIAGAPNIAVGDVLGSCVFNLLLLVVLDFLHRGESVYRSASQGHILLAAFGIVLIGLAAQAFYWALKLRNFLSGILVFIHQSLC